MSHAPDYTIVGLYIIWGFCIIIMFFGFGVFREGGDFTKRILGEETDREKWKRGQERLKKWGDEYKAERRKGNERGIF